MNAGRGRLLLLVLLAAGLLAAAPLSADALRLDVGGHAGTVSVPDGEAGRFVGGVQARLHIIWLFALEARVSRYEDSFDLGKLGGLEVTNTPAQLSLMFYLLPLPRFGLSAVGGATYNTLEAKGTGQVPVWATVNVWAAHAGAGIDVKLWGPLFLNGDVRYTFLDADLGGALGFPLAGGYAGDFWTATAGLNLKLF